LLLFAAGIGTESLPSWQLLLLVRLALLKTSIM
jgi:hypothetical protein